MLPHGIVIIIGLDMRRSTRRRKGPHWLRLRRARPGHRPGLIAGYAERFGVGLEVIGTGIDSEDGCTKILTVVDAVDDLGPS